MRVKQWMMVVLVSLSAAWMPSAAHAQQRNAAAELDAAFSAAKKVIKPGPVDIALRNQAILKLPNDFIFVPQPEADQIMKAMGNGVDSTRLGIIYPVANENWFVVVRYIESGYIKDDEARDWKSEEMLQQIKAGTEDANKERKELGIPAMEIVGWVQAPKYDAGSHRLVWSVESKDKGAASTPDNGINYNTYVLGREGFISMNLVTSMNVVEKHKAVATALLSNTTFNSSKSYGDFNTSTDKVAEYGIAALVAGVAAKKLGMFALIAAFFAKFAKLIILALIGIGAGIRKYFARKKDAAVPVADHNKTDSA